MIAKQPGNRLTRQILWSLLLGALCGVAINLLAHWPAASGAAAWLSKFGANGLFHVLGQIFLRLLQVLVVPLVLVSLISGTAGLDDIRRLGRIGIKTLALYLLTAVSAVSLAIFGALLVGPGKGLTLERAAGFEAQPAQSLVDTIAGLVPRNIFASMAAGDMIPVIVFAILFGVGMTLAGEAGQRLRMVVDDINAVMLKLVGMVMRVAPVGVFALVARTFANEGLAALLPLAKYVLLTLTLLLMFAFLFYPALLKLMTGLSPWPLLRRIRELQLFAFSTASSNASIPISIAAMRQLGIAPAAASFSATLGATINMDGTIIMQGVATVFIAQLYGIDLSAAQILAVVLTATLASIGTAGVPSAGMVMLSMVLLQAGLPVEGIAIILGIDRILDMTRTAVNVSGDVVVGCIVARSEKLLDEAVYQDNRPDLPVVGERAS
ncbi:MAG TPA: dicarboxylate/amino acid:cation symporter [Steroidobacteraceae bacterium]|nr:dicarboxylate/amino acid:cation symporter [Steroidobacteraceae bacterium]